MKYYKLAFLIKYIDPQTFQLVNSIGKVCFSIEGEVDNTLLSKYLRMALGNTMSNYAYTETDEETYNRYEKTGNSIKIDLEGIKGEIKDDQ